jgi:hypothetical protein
MYFIEGEYHEQVGNVIGRIAVTDFTNLFVVNPHGVA